MFYWYTAVGFRLRSRKIIASQQRSIINKYSREFFCAKTSKNIQNKRKNTFLEFLKFKLLKWHLATRSTKNLVMGLIKSGPLSMGDANWSIGIIITPSLLECLLALWFSLVYLKNCSKYIIILWTRMCYHIIWRWLPEGSYCNLNYRSSIIINNTEVKIFANFLENKIIIRGNFTGKFHSLAWSSTQ